jgi:hypothetical protein
MSNIVRPKIIGSEFHMPGTGLYNKCDITACRYKNTPEEAKKCLQGKGCNTGTLRPWKIGWCPDQTVRSWDNRTTQIDCNLLPDTISENYVAIKEKMNFMNNIPQGSPIGVTGSQIPERSSMDMYNKSTYNIYNPFVVPMLVGENIGTTCSNPSCSPERSGRDIMNEIEYRGQNYPHAIPAGSPIGVEKYMRDRSVMDQMQGKMFNPLFNQEYEYYRR